MVALGIVTGPLRCCGLAVQFLTRVPVRLSGAVTPGELAASMAFYPMVGALLGLAVAGIGTGIAFVLPHAVAVVWVLVATALFTGNLHLDGIIDTIDGVFGGYEPARRLEIMKDSRVGAHGVVGAIAVLAMKGSLLLQFEPSRWWMVVPLVFACGRWALVFGAYRFTYARPTGGLGQTYMDQVRGRHLLGATWSLLALGWVLSPFISHLLLIALATWGGAQWAGWYVARRIGGMTGDTLGALNEIVEIVVLTLLVVMQT